jgi:hypothetical protein
VHRGVAWAAGPVEDWRPDSSPRVPAVSWAGDFSSFTRHGQYVIAVGDHPGPLPHSTWFLYAMAIGPTAKPRRTGSIR